MRTGGEKGDLEKGKTGTDGNHDDGADVVPTFAVVPPEEDDEKQSIKEASKEEARERTAIPAEAKV